MTLAYILKEHRRENGSSQMTHRWPAQRQCSWRGGRYTPMRTQLQLTTFPSPQNSEPLTMTYSDIQQETTRQNREVWGVLRWVLPILYNCCTRADPELGIDPVSVDIALFLSSQLWQNQLYWFFSVCQTLVVLLLNQVHVWTFIFSKRNVAGVS